MTLDHSAFCRPLPQWEETQQCNHLQRTQPQLLLLLCVAESTQGALTFTVAIARRVLPADFTALQCAMWTSEHHIQFHFIQGWGKDLQVYGLPWGRIPSHWGVALAAVQDQRLGTAIVSKRNIGMEERRALLFMRGTDVSLKQSDLHLVRVWLAQHSQPSYKW